MTRKEAIIDLNALKFILDNDQYTDEIEEALDAAISALQQPEIIRCKDCKHRYVDGEGVRFNVCELNHNKVQSDDWFCADAEQREGEADG